MKNRSAYCIISLVLILSLSACGGGAGSSSSPVDENPNVPFSVKLIPNQTVAQTNASILLRAKVLDGNGVPMANVPVTFTNLSESSSIVISALRFIGTSKPKAMLSAKVVNTDGNGIATVSIRSTVGGFVTVQAEVNTGVGIVRDKKLINFSDTFNLPVFITLPQLVLDVDTNASFTSPDEPNDFILFKTAGDTQRYIRATVYHDSSISGKIITFGSDDPGEVTLCVPASPPTTPPSCLSGGAAGQEINVVADNNGQATVLATVTPSALTPGTKTINITALAIDGASNVLTLFTEPVYVVPPPASSLSANPTEVALTFDPTNPQPENRSVITATVKINTGGFAPDGTTVNFTATCGSVDAFAQTTDGVAQATFTAPSILPADGKCTVKGKAGGVSIGSADITIIEVLPTGTIAGNVVDHLGAPLSDVTISLFQQDGAPVGTATNNADGTYSITTTVGSYTVEFSKSGYIAFFADNITVDIDTTTTVNAVLTPGLSTGQTRIVLTWGQTPSDLDSHLTGPIQQDSTSRFHVYYADACFPSGSCTTDGSGNRIAGANTIALLDHDDVTSFGPETTTLVQQFNDVYRFSVQDFSNKSSTTSLAMSNSGAKVRVYQGENLLRTFSVPTNQVGTLWTVFELIGNQIIPFNTMSNQSDQTAIQSVLRSTGSLEEKGISKK